MGLPALKIESCSERFRRRTRSGEGRIASPLTHRRVVAETFRYQIDLPHRPVYPGSLLHDLLHALDLAADRSGAAAQLSVEADSAWTRSIEDSAAGGCGVDPYRTVLQLSVTESQRWPRPRRDGSRKHRTGLTEVQHKLLPVKRSVAQVTQATGEIEKLASTNAETKTVEVKRHPITEMFFMRTPELIADVVLLSILLYFLLVYDQVFIAKLVKLLPTLSDKKTAVAIAHDIESQISRYLFTITAINACLGVAVGTAVGLLGLHNPVMWGVMVAVLNFVPYLGALTGIICMTIGAVLSFDSLGYASIFPGRLSRFWHVGGKFHHPWVMGRSLTLNPVIILSLAHFLGLDVGNRRHHFGCTDLGRFQDFLRAHQTDGAACRVS